MALCLSAEIASGSVGESRIKSVRVISVSMAEMAVVMVDSMAEGAVLVTKKVCGAWLLGEAGEGEGPCGAWAFGDEIG